MASLVQVERELISERNRANHEATKKQERTSGCLIA